MGVLKWGAVGAIAVSMVASSAFAADVSRSAQALPGAQAAPTAGVRTAAPLKHKSNQSGDGAAAGYVLAAVVGAGIVAAAIVGSDNDSDYHQPSSPG